MLKVSTGCFDHLFRIWIVTVVCHLLVLSPRFLLHSTMHLAGLPHLQQVVDLDYSIQLSFHHLSRQFEVVSSACRIQYCVIACQDSVIRWSKLPCYNLFAKCLSSDFGLPPADYIWFQGKTGLYSVTMWYDTEYIVWHAGEIGILWVHIPLLAPPAGDIQPPMVGNLMSSYGPWHW